MLMRFLLLTSLCHSMLCSAFCSRTKEEYTIPFGACVWSTGVAMHPLLKQVLMDFASMSFCTILYTDMQKVNINASMLSAWGCSCSRACQRARRHTSGPL